MEFYMQLLIPPAVFAISCKVQKICKLSDSKVNTQPRLDINSRLSQNATKSFKISTIK